MITPVNNQVLIEVIDEYAGLSHSGGDDQRGIVRACNVLGVHLTASTGFALPAEAAKAIATDVATWIDKPVRYALYADADSSKFTEDGKNYVLIPWYRVLGVEK